jgi:hypothetical protein
MTNWQSNQIISNSPGFYNTSACYDGSRYVMALDQGNDGWFNITFAQSSDGTNYSLIGSTYYNTNNGPCNSSPTIRYSGGYYYMIYWGSGGGYRNGGNYITRSTDLTNWQDSIKAPVLIAEISYDTGGFASDLDLVEYNGQTHIYYGDGDQSSWCNIRRAVYNGTMANFFNWFYN